MRAMHPMFSWHTLTAMAPLVGADLSPRETVVTPEEPDDTPPPSRQVRRAKEHALRKRMLA